VNQWLPSLDGCSGEVAKPVVVVVEGEATSMPLSRLQGTSG
jgi:hypothetical protein